MIIYNNLMADNANRQLGINNKAQAGSMEKLSSGMRINRAGDDAAGLAISEKMRNQINGLNQASRNAQDGISLIQTAEGALGETQEMLARMRELSIQSMNDTYTDSDRDKLNLEVNQLLQEIDGIAAKTEFNEQLLLYGDGSVTYTNNTVGTSNINAEYAAMSKTDLNALIAQTEAAMYADMDAHIAAWDTTMGSLFGASELVDLKAALQNLSDTNATNDDGTAYYELELDQLANMLNYASWASVESSISTEIGLATTSTFDTDAFTTTIESLNEMKTALAAMSEQSYDTSISGSRTFEFQVGANQDQKINVTIDAMGVFSLGLEEVNVGTKAEASASLEMIDAAIEQISQQRALLGAVQNRLEHTIKNVDNTAENLQSAESNIRDTDMAEEMVELTKYNILSQASQSMLAQANQTPQQVLQLLS
ncbi:MAG: hypothetical protein BEN18_10165 [Epulopiscium sp. Nuni2H_MBin001]|nr:MAG: hypothetical protein BEN18_10165 [Epulopiscium sp. Nuni2H_MBin001]